jgi:hypothetical protein
VLLVIPETKGKSLEAIEQMWIGKSHERELEQV